MRVLVTGGTGFVGRHAIPALLDRGFEVHAVTSRAAPGQQEGVVWHHADLFEPASVRAVCARVRPTHLLHLAWFVEPGSFWNSPENLRWVAASLDVVRAFVEGAGRRMLVAGTCAEYRWSDADLSEGSTPLEPGSLYGTAKDALRRQVASIATQHGLGWAWGRLFFLYGPHEARARLVPSVATALLRGEVARCTSGRAVRDYLHVGDAGDALAAILASDVSGPVNVASGDAVPVRRIVEAVARHCGRPDLAAIGALPDRPDEPLRVCADTTRLQSEVGWQPAMSLESGLRSTVEWWSQQLREADHDAAR